MYIQEVDKISNVLLDITTPPLFNGRRSVYKYNVLYIVLYNINKYYYVRLHAWKCTIMYMFLNER